MGTRFMACAESPIHDRVKQAIVAADDLATLSWGRTTEIARTLANDFARRFRQLELSGASAGDLHALIADYPPGTNRRVGGLLHGDLAEGEVYLGAGAGLVRNVVSAREIIEGSLAEARASVQRLQQAF